MVLGIAMVFVSCVFGHLVAGKAMGVRWWRFGEDPGGGSGRRSRLAWSMVTAAGPLAAYLVIGALLAFSLARGGRDESTLQIAQVVEPASSAGVRTGDRVVAVDGRPLRNFEELRAAIARRRPQAIELTVERSEGRASIRVTPNSEGRIGVSSLHVRARASGGEIAGEFLLGPIRVVGTTVGAPWLMTWGGRDRVVVGGPVVLYEAVRDVPKREVAVAVILALLAAQFWIPVSLIDLILFAILTRTRAYRDPGVGMPRPSAP